MTKRTPTRLKILRGEKRSKVNLAEPIAPAARIEDAPDYLVGAALEKWNEIFPILSKVAVLTESDVTGLARYCELFRMWMEIRDYLVANGYSYPIVNDAGQVKYHTQRPEVSIFKNLTTQLRQLEQDYGLSPTSRQGLKVATAGEADPLDEFLAAPTFRTK